LDSIIDYDLLDEIILDLAHNKTEKLNTLNQQETISLLHYAEQNQEILELIVPQIPSDRLNIDDWLLFPKNKTINFHIAQSLKTNGLPNFQQISTLIKKCFNDKTSTDFVIQKKYHRLLEKISDWETIVKIFNDQSLTELYWPLALVTIPLLIEKQVLNYSDFNFDNLTVFNNLFKTHPDNYIFYNNEEWLHNLYVSQIKNASSFWKIYDQAKEIIKKKHNQDISIGDTRYNYNTFLYSNRLPFFVSVFNDIPHGFADSIKFCNKFFEYDEFNYLFKKQKRKLSYETETYIDSIVFKDLNGYSSLKLDMYEPVYSYLLTRETPNLAKAVKETFRNYLPITYKY